MAEAHQAVGFSFQVTHDGLEVDFDHEVIVSIFNSGVRSLHKHFQRHWVRLNPVSISIEQKSEKSS